MPAQARRPVALLTALLAAAGALAGAVAGSLPTAPDVPGAVSIAVLTLYLVVGGALFIPVRYRGQADLVDLFDVALAPALVVLPGPVLVAAVALAKASALIARGLPLAK